MSVFRESVVLLQVPYRLLNAYHQIQSRLIRELEKKFSGKDVIIVGVRRILSVPKVGYTRARPRSRTLTSVNMSMLSFNVKWHL